MSNDSELDDQQLVHYLLRLLPEEDSERLDELSIADEEVAWRLRVVEDDLVDAYVSGLLPAEWLERFESFYLSSERRRQKVQFARSVLHAVDRTDEPSGAHAPRDPVRAPEAERRGASSRDVPAHGPIAPRSQTVWRAAAAALVLLACGGLLFQDVRLRNGRDEARRESVALDRRAHELERQLEAERQANAEAVKELARVRASLAALAQRSAAAPPPDGTQSALQALTTALVLLPQTRAVGAIPTLAVPPDADRVRFDLRLELNDFPRYEVALKDPATNQIIWRSGRVTARSLDHQSTVTVGVPASVLKPQHYSFQLSGQSAQGRAEVIGSYAVRILR